MSTEFLYADIQGILLIQQIYCASFQLTENQEGSIEEIFDKFSVVILRQESLTVIKFLK